MFFRFFWRPCVFFNVSKRRGCGDYNIRKPLLRCRETFRKMDRDDVSGPAPMNQEHNSKIKMADTSSKTPKKSSEQYACESLARSMKTWIVYDKKESLEKWLNTNAPSKAFQLEDVGWVSMPSLGDDIAVDYDKLDVSWQELKSSGRTVDYYSVLEIARDSGMLSGTWLAHVNSDLKADLLWSKIAREFANGALAGGVATSCKVSHHDGEGRSAQGSYVFSISGTDFSDRESVYELERAIRVAGIKSRLMYKPAVYTHLGIYRNNEFNIRPSIYSSDYDILKKTSTVIALYESAEKDRKDSESDAAV